VIEMADISALVQVIVVDLVLAGDNGIVIALAVAGFAARDRLRLLVLGIAAAAFVRILLSLVATQLIHIVGLMLAGGLLLLWVCWKLWRELEARRCVSIEFAGVAGPIASSAAAVSTKPKSAREAIAQIVLADISMSLDNVLAVAGIARNNAWVLVFGLLLSIGCTAFAAVLIARVLNRHYWIAYLGMAIILYVAMMLIWDGALNLVSDQRLGAAH
jgi:YjbE family integral membrane protein